MDRSPPSRTGRVIHGAMIAGMTFTVLVLSLMPSTAGLDDGMQLLLTYLPFAIAGACFAAAFILTGRLPSGPADRDEWWRMHTGRAVAVWGMIEGPSIFAAVAYFLTRNPIPLVIPMAGLVVFLLTSPGRLEPH